MLPRQDAGGTGLIPGWGTKIPHATVRPKKKKRKKQRNVKRQQLVGSRISKDL